MPYTILHLELADRILNTIKLDRSQFLIGSMAPDAIHMRKNATIEEKRTIHMYGPRDISLRFQNLTNFYQKYEGQINQSYLFGWLSHLQADFLMLYWLNWHFKLRYIPEMNKDTRKHLYRTENSCLESAIYHGDPDKFDGIINSITDSEITEIPGILTKNEIAQWISDIRTRSYEKSKLDNTYFTMSRTMQFFDIATSIIIKSIQVKYDESILNLLEGYQEDYLVEY
jgi:hypothetical protein